MTTLTQETPISADSNAGQSSRPGSGKLASQVAASIAPQYAHSFLPQLDGLRGMAILLVLLHHIAPGMLSYGLGPLTDFGWVGVDLFFVLSGFLITRILVSGRSAPHYFRNFYARRALRIWPLYYAFVIFTAIALLLLGHSAHYQELFASSQFSAAHLGLRTPFWMYLLLLQNLYIPSLWGFSDVMLVTWSLCVEEHFYLVWPLIVRFFRISYLKALLVAALIAQPLIRLAAFLLNHRPPDDYFVMIYRSTPFHLDGIIAGSLLGLIYLQHGPSFPRFRPLFAAMALLGATGSAFCIHHTYDAPVMSLGFTAIAITFSGLLGLALCGSFYWFLTARWLRWTGKVSYGIYLIHSYVFLAFSSHVLRSRLGFRPESHEADPLFSAAAVLVTFLLAALSWRFFESPILRLKRYVPA